MSVDDLPEVEFSGFTADAEHAEDLCDVLMEALLGHPRVVDPSVSATLSSGSVTVSFLLRPEV